MTNPSHSILQAKSIGRRLPTRNELFLRDVHVSIRAGQRVAVVGPSGSGKTLLLRALALIDPLDTGEVFWHGKRVCGAEIPAYRGAVIYLHQRPALAEGTVEQILRKPFLLAAHHDKKFDHGRLVALLRRLGRDQSFLAKPQSGLSGGESQITALLRAIQLDPEVLLLDEPTAALDADISTSVELLVYQWLHEQPETRACVWVSHDIEQSRRVSDRIIQLNAGQLSEVD